MTLPVSVVIPTHNRAELVGRAIRSVLDQSDPPAEVVVVDDYSSDATPDALAAFGDRITVIRTARNVERGAARNLGARASRSELLAFLDSDDEWVPSKLTAQMPAARSGKASVTGLQYIDSSGRPTGADYEPPPGAAGRITTRNEFLGAPSSLVIPRLMFESVGGFVEERAVQGYEDWLFLMRLVLRGHPLEVVREPLVRYRYHAGNDLGDPRRLQQSATGAIAYIERERLIEGPALRRLKAYLAGELGRAFAFHGDWRAARRCARGALSAGAPLEAARALTMISATGGKAVLRRVRDRTPATMPRP